MTLTMAGASVRESLQLHFKVVVSLIMLHNAPYDVTDGEWLQDVVVR